MQGVWNKSRFSTNIVLYLGNDTRYSYIHNDGPIESRIWSIERRHFQWTTPNPDFKVTPFFDAEYLRNGKIQTQLYRNTNRDLRRTQGHHFKWPWVPLSDSEIFIDTKHCAISAIAELYTDLFERTFILCVFIAIIRSFTAVFINVYIRYNSVI